MIRNRIGGDIYPVQEVDGMHVINVYAAADDFTRYIMSKLSDEQKEEFKDCQWYPIRINTNNNDLTVDFTLVALK